LACTIRVSSSSTAGLVGELEESAMGIGEQNERTAAACARSHVQDPQRLRSLVADVAREHDVRHDARVEHVAARLDHDHRSAQR
jgi:hypothetical protein